MKKKAYLKAGMEEGINAGWAKLARESGWRLELLPADQRRLLRQTFAAGFADGMMYGGRMVQEGLEAKPGD